jgi:biotin carboxylase
MSFAILTSSKTITKGKILNDVTGLIKKFAGKKLLLLGTSAGTTDMVNYARSQGAYVIVTDNLPPEKSAAKLIADESWRVSTADVDSLEKLVIQNKVNGVSAGASDFNTEKVLSLCERVGLPFYCDRKQWEICSNKPRFKQLCLANGVQIAKEYHLDGSKKEGLNQIKYPVIVKPADASAGIGIGICNSENELLKAYTRAVSLSKTKQAVIEELIVGDEFTAAYTIKDGKFSLTYIADRYVTEPEETMPLPLANILPSKYTDQYIEELNECVIKMFQSIGLNNGFIFIQGTRNKDGFYIFETNYRLAGFLLHRFTGKTNGINYMEMLVNYALTGKMNEHELPSGKPEVDKYCCNLVRVSKGGVVGKIVGLEEILKKKNLIATDNLYKVGDYIEKSGTLRQVHLRFYLIEDSLQELKNSIKEIQETVKVLDAKGNDMLIPPLDTDRI